MDVSFTGSTPESAPITFRGTLVLTNAPAWPMCVADGISRAPG